MILKGSKIIQKEISAVYMNSNLSMNSDHLKKIAKDDLHHEMTI